MKSLNFELYKNEWTQNFDYHHITDSNQVYINMSYSYYYSKLSDFIIKKNSEDILDKFT